MFAGGEAEGALFGAMDIEMMGFLFGEILRIARARSGFCFSFVELCDFKAKGEVGVVHVERSSVVV